MKNTWQKVFNFLVYVGNMLPFCYAKSQYQAIDDWKSASHWIKLPFLMPSHFWLIFLWRSCFCQPAIFKVIDLECIDWSQIKVHCLYTQKSTNYLSIKASLKDLGQFVWKLRADKETKITQMIWLWLKTEVYTIFCWLPTIKRSILKFGITKW